MASNPFLSGGGGFSFSKPSQPKPKKQQPKNEEKPNMSFFGNPTPSGFSMFQKNESLNLFGEKKEEKKQDSSGKKKKDKELPTGNMFKFDLAANNENEEKKPVSFFNTSFSQEKPFCEQKKSNSSDVFGGIHLSGPVKKEPVQEKPLFEKRKEEEPNIFQRSPILFQQPSRKDEENQKKARDINLQIEEDLKKIDQIYERKAEIKQELKKQIHELQQKFMQYHSTKTKVELKSTGEIKNNELVERKRKLKQRIDQQQVEKYMLEKELREIEIEEEEKRYIVKEELLEKYTTKPPKKEEKYVSWEDLTKFFTNSDDVQTLRQDLNIAYNEKILLQEQIKKELEEYRIVKREYQCENKKGSMFKNDSIFKVEEESQEKLKRLREKRQKLREKYQELKLEAKKKKNRGHSNSYVISKIF